MSYADKVIEVAEQWLGYLEKKSASQLEALTANAGDGNYTIFAQEYKRIWGENYQGQPWCAMFASYCVFQACGKDLTPHFAYCPSGVNAFKAKNQWHKDKPQRGDLIFFTNGNRACHVGLVTSVGGGKVVTIEGNTSSAAGVEANGGCVRKKSYNLDYSRILGYGRPDYTALDKAAQTAATQGQEDDMTIYKTIYKTKNDVPAWATATVTKLLAKGALQGDDKGNLNLEHNALRNLVINDRMGLYGA